MGKYRHSMKNFLKTLSKNVTGSFKKKNLFWHVLAFLATYLIVISGFDWYYFVVMQSEILHTIFWPGIAIGGLVPILFPLTLIIAGKIGKNKPREFFGWALGQAALTGWFVSALYKFFTGRVQPNMRDTIIDISNNFNFGFYEHGIFWGWPSSHTTVAFAMAVTSIYILKSKPAKYIAMAYAFYIGVAVSFSIHWFSDFVAGAIMGTIVGMVVGKNADSLFAKEKK